MINLSLGDQQELFDNVADKSVKAVITDPPYGVLEHKIETCFDFEMFCENCNRVLTDDGFVALTSQEPATSRWFNILNNYFKFKTKITWVKPNATNPVLYPQRKTEDILIFGRKKAKLKRIYTAVINEAAVNELILKLIKKINNNELTSLYEIMNYLAVGKKQNCYADNNSRNDTIYDRFKQTKYRYSGYRLLSDVWEVLPHNKQKTNSGDDYNVKHPTVKPIQLFERLVRITTNEADTVLDSFMGSGTTGIACRALNRNFLGWELDNQYYQAAKKRIDCFNYKLDAIMEEEEMRGERYSPHVVKNINKQLNMEDFW